jgi:hypothetical protein
MDQHINDHLHHRKGRRGPRYVDKAGSLARAQSGKPLDISGPYHQQSWDLICKLVRDMGTEMAAKARSTHQSSQQTRTPLTFAMLTNTISASRLFR